MMAYPCPTCHGRHGWWVTPSGERLMREPWRFPEEPAHWRECHDCLTGISSCCEGAVGGPDEITNQGLPEKCDG